jgi:hypothetical protein
MEHFEVHNEAEKTRVWKGAEQSGARTDRPSAVAAALGRKV